MTTLKQSPAMMHQWTELLDQKGSMQFRRSDLVDRLYALTNPRSRLKADKHADAIIKRAAKTGEIARVGHLHWKRVTTSRTLRSGRVVKEIDGLAALTLQTHCPEKWVSIDLETGELWMGTEAGWKRATPDVNQEVREMLFKAS